MHKTPLYLSGLLVFCTAGCHLVHIDPGDLPEEPPPLAPFWAVDSTLFQIKLLNDQELLFGVAGDLSAVFTNRTDSTLYLPLCGYAVPSPDYERMIDGVWRANAFVFARALAGCTEALPVEPGASHTEVFRLLFRLRAKELPYGSRRIEDVYGRYRLRFRVYGESWSNGSDFPPDTVVPDAFMLSNSFDIVGAE